MAVIYAHWLRQLRRYIRCKSKIISSIGQPILYLIAMGFGLGPTFRDAGQGTYVQFIAPGVIAMAVVFSSIFSGMDLLLDRQSGLLKAIMVTPPSRLTHMLGRTSGGATVAVIQGSLVLVVSQVAGFRLPSIHALVCALAFMSLLALMFTALGVAIGATLSDLSGFQVFTNFIVMPILFFSGTLYPLTHAPKWIVVVASLNPFSYGVDGMRVGLIGTASPFGLVTDVVVVAAVTVILLGAGAYLFSRIEF